MAVGASIVLAFGLIGCGAGNGAADPTTDAPETSVAATGSTDAQPPETSEAAPPGDAGEMTTEVEGVGPVTVDAGSMIFTVPEGASYKVTRGYYVDENIFVDAEVTDLPRDCRFDLNRTSATGHDEYLAEWRESYVSNFADDEWIDMGQQTHNGQLYEVVFQKGNVKRMWYVGWLPTANESYSANIRIYCTANEDGTLAAPEAVPALLDSIIYVDKEAEVAG